jgi:hypothetical protein
MALACQSAARSGFFVSHLRLLDQMTSEAKCDSGIPLHAPIAHGTLAIAIPPPSLLI